MKDADARALLRDLFDAALAAAQPSVCLPPLIDALAPPKGRTVVIGAGKAAVSMARVLEARWPHPFEGLVVAREYNGAKLKKTEVVVAAHPNPNERSREAAGHMLEKVKDLTADDLLLCLISGGASSLLVWPAPGLTLADKQQVNAALLASGAPIGQMNIVRKHLSAIKGGRLAIAAKRARILSWLISDVPDDDPAVIGSGPTVADKSTFADALAVLAKYKITPPASVLAHLQSGAAGKIEETPKPDDPRLADVQTVVTATAEVSLQAAAKIGRERGYEVVILGSHLEGVAHELGAEHAREALDIARGGGRPTIVLSGGETTVRLQGNGKGGRNVEYLLSEAIAAKGAPSVWGLAADTDGVDGAKEIAGAIFTPDTLARAKAKRLNPQAMLDNNDGHSFFEALGDSVITGPTGTNVNDFRATLIAP